VTELKLETNISKLKKTNLKKMNIEKIMWAPKISIRKPGADEEFLKLLPVQVRAQALELAEKLFDETEYSISFGVDRVDI